MSVWDNPNAEINLKEFLFSADFSREHAKHKLK